MQKFGRAEPQSIVSLTAGIVIGTAGQRNDIIAITLERTGRCSAIAVVGTQFNGYAPVVKPCAGNVEVNQMGVTILNGTRQGRSTEIVGVTCHRDYRHLGKPWHQTGNSTEIRNRFMR